MLRSPAPRGCAALLSVVLVGGLLGCTDPGADPGAGPPTPAPGRTTGAAGPDVITDADFDAVADLLDSRADALLAGRKRAFLATLDPGEPRLRRTQATFFDNLQALPLDRFYYGVASNGLVPAAVRGDDRVVAPVVFEHVELTGVFAAPVANQVSMTFVERDGRWLLGAEDVDETFEAQARPWYGGAVEAAGDDEVLVLTDRGADVGADELLAATREALAVASSVLDEDDDRGLFLDATTNGLASELSNASGEEAGAVSYNVFAADRAGDDYTRFAAAVVKANPGRVEQLVGAGGTTLRHELTHFLLDGYGDTNPQWVTEGIAEYVGYSPGLLADSVATDDRLLRAVERRDVELTPAGLWGSDPDLDYLSAHAFAEHLITTYGVARYREMMDVFERRGRRSAVRFGEGQVDAVLRQVYGVGAQEVAQAGFVLLRGLAG